MKKYLVDYDLNDWLNIRQESYFDFCVEHKDIDVAKNAYFCMECDARQLRGDEVVNEEIAAKK